MKMFNKKDWIFDRHSSTNHKYDNDLPYSFHLKMVERVGKKFLHLMKNEPYYDNYGLRDHIIMLHDVCLTACLAHDLIEDTRVSYNDVSSMLGQEVADVVYALTNEKGKNRAERGNVKYYEGIKSTKGATFVKLCDRIANIQYSKMVESRMFDMYKKEHNGFCDKIGRYEKDSDAYQLKEMFEYLDELFKD